MVRLPSRENAAVEDIAVPREIGVAAGTLARPCSEAPYKFVARHGASLRARAANPARRSGGTRNRSRPRALVSNPAAPEVRMHFRPPSPDPGVESMEIPHA